MRRLGREAVGSKQMLVQRQHEALEQGQRGAPALAPKASSQPSKWALQKRIKAKRNHRLFLLC